MALQEKINKCMASILYGLPKEIKSNYFTLCISKIKSILLKREGLFTSELSYENCRCYPAHILNFYFTATLAETFQSDE